MLSVKTELCGGNQSFVVARNSETRSKEGVRRRKPSEFWELLLWLVFFGSVCFGRFGRFVC